MDLDQMAGTYEALCTAARYHRARGEQEVADAEIASAARIADELFTPHTEPVDHAPRD